MSDTLDIKLLGKDYRVACPPDQRESLQEAVELLAERLGEVAAKTKGTGERLAVMTALNLAHELLSQKYPSSGIDTRELRRRIGAMEVRLDEAMAEQEKLF
jgi:cell division protein ZapA